MLGVATTYNLKKGNNFNPKIGFISKAHETKLTNRMLQFDFEALNIGAVNINYTLYCESCGGWSNVLNHRSPITF